MFSNLISKNDEISLKNTDDFNQILEAKKKLRLLSGLEGPMLLGQVHLIKVLQCHGKFNEHSEAWWRTFIKIYYSLKREIQSLTKKMVTTLFKLFVMLILKEVSSRLLNTTVCVL